MVKIKAKVKVSKSKHGKGHGYTKTERALNKKGKYLVYKDGMKEIRSKHTTGDSRLLAKNAGFAWMQNAHGVGIKGATAQQIRNALLAAQRDLMQQALEQKSWDNASGNAMAAFMSGVYDWGANLYTISLSQQAGYSDKPTYKLRNGVFRNNHDKRGKHAANRVHVGYRWHGGGAMYKISDNNLIEDYPEMGYERALQELEMAQSMLGTVRNSKEHEYQQTLKFVHPIAYIKDNLLGSIERHAKSTVNHYVQQQIAILQKAINTMPLRDALGRFVKGTPMGNVARDARGRFVSKKK